MVVYINNEELKDSSFLGYGAVLLGDWSSDVTLCIWGVVHDVSVDRRALFQHQMVFKTVGTTCSVTGSL